MRLSPVQLDRATGVLLGLAAGDALGAGYEFGAAVPDPDAAMIGGGPFGFAPGEWTDDTQMAICIAQAAATGHLEPFAVGERFLDWIGCGPRDVGVQTRAVLRAASGPDDLPRLATEHFEANPGNSAGNGSLMRTGPVALAHLGDDGAIAAAARGISSLTHADPLAADACVLWCIALDRAVREGRLDGIYDGLALVPVSDRDKWASRIREAETSPPATFRPNGFVVTALQAAWSAITHTPAPTDRPCRHLQDGLQAAVKIGDDTDTVAAIAGSLLGARWGASALPIAWRQALHGWPGLRAPDLARLAVLSVFGGKGDAAGWPSAPTLLPYYEKQFPGRPVAGALPDDTGIVVGNVHALRHSTQDAVISLCRVGRRDVPAAYHDEIWLIDDPDPAANPNLAFVLDEVVALIGSHRRAGRTVFLHCVMGESRTPLVAAAYVARTNGISGVDALERVWQALPQARLNPGFWDVLQTL